MDGENDNRNSLTRADATTGPLGDGPSSLGPADQASTYLAPTVAPVSALVALPQVVRPERRTLLPFRRRPVEPRKGDPEGFKGRPHHVLISALVLTLLISVIMLVPLLPDQIDVQPDVPATQNVFSPTFLRYESTVLTDKARDEARQDPANQVWVQDTQVVQRLESVLLNNLSILDDLRSDETASLDSKRQRLSSMQGVTLTQKLQDTLLLASDSDYRYWHDNAVLAGFEEIIKRRIASEADVEATRAVLPDLLVPGLTPDQRDAAIAFLSPLVTINMHLDAAQTQDRADAAAADVKPVIVTVQKGEAILRQGDLVTPEAVEKMQKAGLLTRTLSAQGVAGTIGIVSLLMLLLHLYIYRYVQQVWQRYKQLLLMGLLIVGTVAVSRLILPGHGTLPYLLPLAAVSMLISVLLSPNLAVMVSFVLSVLLGVVVTNGLSMDLPIYYFVSGVIGIFTLTRIERVSAFARAGFYIAVSAFMTVLALRIFGGSAPTWTDVGTLALVAAFNAGVSTSITYATFSLLGTIFGITTPVQLMELAHPDQPLLRRLMREAPGTYHHSLVVSNLAERAAEMVGADALLTRVCAYYHDIGKVARPHHFIDNQAGMKNIHDDLDPRTSAAIIAEHVKDGIRLAVKARLPKRVQDAIPQHHGTMLIKYFYHKALALDPNVNPDDFRYPGPKPQTKENAILMLADGVEATVRSMAQSGALDMMAMANGVGNSDATETPNLYTDALALPEDAIASVVHKIVSDRIEDGQLDECDLTVRDIARIQEAFVSMLKGIYHPRVPYPEKPEAPPQVTVQPVVVAGEAKVISPDWSQPRGIAAGGGSAAAATTSERKHGSKPRIGRS